MPKLLFVACAAVLFLVSKAAPRARGQSNPAITTRSVIDRFNEAFNRHDPDGVAALLTDDTVFEDTSLPHLIFYASHRCRIQIGKRVRGRFESRTVKTKPGR